ncbi:MAG: acyl-CoA dehydrogenase family protein [Thaumarchaeota archaeon]|nr:acyl-CoA dehydrogenase family protein [Nitrososphaerota archaeon]
MSHDDSILETVREFVQKEIKPIASEIDDRMLIPPSTFEKMSSLNLFGMLAPESFGGVSMTFSSFLKVIEEFSRHSPSIALVLATHNAIALFLLNRFGSQQQKDTFLRDMVEGKKIGSVSVGNKGSFLNIDDLNVRATKSSGNSYSVSGSNSVILNGSYGNIFLVLCRFENEVGFVILADDDSNTLKVKTRNLLGLKGGGISSFKVSERRVLVENILGKFDDGHNIVRVAQENFCLYMSAISIGISRESMKQAVLYAKNRVQFGKPISKFEAIQDLIGEMAIGCESSSALLQNLGNMKNNGDRIGMKAVISRLLSSRVAAEISRSALKVHGGYGFIRDFPVERYVRDAETVKILGDVNHDLLMLVGEKVAQGGSY